MKITQEMNKYEIDRRCHLCNNQMDTYHNHFYIIIFKDGTLTLACKECVVRRRLLEDEQIKQVIKLVYNEKTT